MIDHIQLISVGDMIEAINGQSLLGCRHYEVARLLKELPRGRTFTLKLTEPRKAFGEGLLPTHPATPALPPVVPRTTSRWYPSPAGGNGWERGWGSPTLLRGEGVGSPPSSGGGWRQGGSCPHTQLPGAISLAKRPQPGQPPSPKKPGLAALCKPAYFFVQLH